MLSPRPAACAGPVCVQHACILQTGLTYCRRVYILCDFLWPEVQPHSDDSQMHVTAPCSAGVLSQARPTMSCIF